MEQKDYILEIVIVLLKENMHIREIAKKININHMMISRKMKELEEENVVDYKEEGKNKVFFLKKSIEARNYIFIAENYKLKNLIKKYSHLRQIIEKIQEHKKINLAIIFGSYAKGIAKPSSDIDLYIETINSKLKKEIETINSNLNVKIGRYDKSNLLIKEIEKNHIIIKGIEVYYGQNKFFE